MTRSSGAPRPGETHAPAGPAQAGEAARVVSIALERATAFLDRARGLLGRAPPPAGQGLWIAPCSAVHTFGMGYPIDVAFLDARGLVLRVRHAVPPFRFARCAGAASVVELAAGEAGALRLRAGDRVPLPDDGAAATPAWPRTRAHARRARRDRGVAAFETLVAIPLLLLLGLSALQWMLLLHAHSAVQRAAIEGARAGSVDHASPEAVERGFARGLLPWLYGAADPAEHAANLERTRAHVAAGRAAGWIRWRQLSPTAASFEDWAEPAIGDDGHLIAGLREIPNDNLTARSTSMLPASGVAGHRGDEPIGSASGQTLLDANLLRIELTYGVPLVVPLVGRLAAWVMRTYDGCAPPAPRRLGAVDLGTPIVGAAPRAWACAFYDARDESGRARPRWPVRVAATIRMQSPARTTGDSADDSVADGAAGVSGPPSLGLGDVDPARDFAPIPVAELNPNGASAGSDGSADRAPGFLRIGSERLLPVAGLCKGR